jgi:beta-lactamase superfamily II metal-dependent hydrolase
MDDMNIIKSFSIGEGDMFYIKHGSDNFTIIDCCLTEENKTTIVDELKSESKNKGVIRFISTHPDDDHILGLSYLNEKMNLLNFYCVENEVTKKDETDDFNEYCILRNDSKKTFYLYRGCSRKWMNTESEERGSSGINVLWPVIDNENYKDALKSAKEGNSPNNISPIIKYSLNGRVTILWMGDLESNFMESIKDAIAVEPVDILFAPHHGRDSGKIPKEWLDKMNPKIIIIGEAPGEDLNYYVGYNTITQNSAGDIILECNFGETHIYVSNYDYTVYYLDDEEMSDTYGKYIGTLKV